MAKQKHILDEAHELVGLAAIYVDDGAFLTAADRLRKAAALIEQHAENCKLAEGGA